MNSELTAAAISLLQGPITTIVEKISNAISTDHKRKVEVQKYQDKFLEYCCSELSSCSYLQSIIKRGTPILLDTIFVDLTISKKDVTTISDQSDEPEKLFELAKIHHNILLSDSAGMGKSTLLKKFTLDCFTSGIIPIRVEMKNLEDNSIYDYINAKLEFDIFKLSENALFSSQKIYLIFDGIDETKYERRSAILKEINDFANLGRYHIIVSSREIKGLSSLSKFTEFYINPLTAQQRTELLRKICSLRRQDEVFLSALEKAIELSYNEIESLLSNPLLVCLLYVSYSMNKKLHTNKTALYRKLVETLFEEHDLSKDGFVRDMRSSLGLIQVNHILGELAIEYFVLSVNSMPYLDLLSKLEVIISDNFKHGDKTVNLNYVLTDIIEGMCLLRREGEMVFWVHKSIMEYFIYYMYKEKLSNENKSILEDFLLSNDGFSVCTSLLVENNCFHVELSRLLPQISIIMEKYTDRIDYLLYMMEILATGAFSLSHHDGILICFNFSQYLIPSTSLSHLRDRTGDRFNRFSRMIGYNIKSAMDMRDLLLNSSFDNLDLLNIRDIVLDILDSKALLTFSNKSLIEIINSSSHVDIERHRSFSDIDIFDANVESSRIYVYNHYYFKLPPEEQSQFIADNDLVKELMKDKYFYDSFSYLLSGMITWSGNNHKTKYSRNFSSIINRDYCDLYLSKLRMQSAQFNSISRLSSLKK